MPATPFVRLFEDNDFNEALTQVLLPGYLPKQRWFTSKGKSIDTCQVDAVYPVQEDAGIVTVSVKFSDGSRERYQMPLAINASPERRSFYQEDYPKLILGEITGTGMLADAVPRADFRARLYEMILNNENGEQGLNAEAGRALRSAGASQKSVVPAIDTSNTAIIYDDRFFFKLFRKLDVGLNPDLELVRFLSERTEFDNCPPYGGSLGVGSMENDDEYLNLGLMTGKVDNRGDAWELFQELTQEYFADDDRSISTVTIVRARPLGERTAEMHRALASAGADRPDLAPETMTPAYRGEITDAALRLLERQFAQLAEKMAQLPGPDQVLARRVLGIHSQLNDRLSSLRDRDMQAQLTRIHGDYHLGQVLYTDSDFYIIDFEGEPLLTIPERRRKRPPLKDVGGMVRSFH
ncbi:MAG: phosphotransferase, partial [Lewinella sp.]